MDKPKLSKVQRDAAAKLGWSDADAEWVAGMVATDSAAHDVALRFFAVVAEAMALHDDPAQPLRRFPLARRVGDDLERLRAVETLALALRTLAPSTRAGAKRFAVGGPDPDDVFDVVLAAFDRPTENIGDGRLPPWKRDKPTMHELACAGIVCGYRLPGRGVDETIDGAIDAIKKRRKRSRERVSRGR